MPAISVYSNGGASVPLRWLGSSCLVAWFLIVACPNQSVPFVGLDGMYLVAGVLIACAVSRFSPIDIPCEFRRSSWVVSGVSLCLISFILCADFEWGLLEIGDWVVHVLMLVAGLLFTVLLIGWIELYARMKTDAMTLIIMSSVSMSALIYFALWAVRSEFWGMGWMALPVVSVVALRSNVPRQIPQDENLEKSKQRLEMNRGELAKRICFLSLLCLGLGVSYAYVEDVGVGSEGMLLPLGMGLIGIVCIFGLWVMFSRMHGTTVLQYVSVFVLLSSAVLMLVTAPCAMILNSLLNGVLAALILFFAVVICVDVAVTFDVPTRRIRFSTFVPSLLCLAMGMIVYEIARYFTFGAPGELCFVVMVTMALIGFAYLVYFKPTWVAYEMSTLGSGYDEELVIGEITSQISELISNLSLGDEPSSTPPSLSEGEQAEYWHKRLAEISAEYDLSPRQAEIYAYLTRGRNADYIANQLVISTNTVRTHIAGIYRKLEIHTQQELLSMFYRD